MDRCSGKFLFVWGYGFDEVSTNEGYLNDVWKYDVTINQWVWLSGDKTVNNFSSTIYPGADYGTGISWADENKNFWYFTNAKMWKYQTSTNSWSTIGSTPPYGNANYGSMGTESSANFPGDRNKALTWTGKDGNLWLFGGNSASLQNLWKYNTNTNNWTWMYGPQTSSSYDYGQLNVPSNTNLPPYRRYSATWNDNVGNLYFFGGTQTDTYDHLNYNDVWKIDMTNYYLDTNELLKTNEKFKVYPTLFSNEVTVESGESFEKIIVSDFSGKNIKTLNFNSNKNQTINLDNLNVGAYILSIYGSKNSILFSTKIIKK